MKKICLGTAMWGWSIERSSVFKLLDFFYNQGGRFIDTATNYPINSDLESYSAAVKLIEDWSKANGIHNLRVIYKLGSVNNTNNPICDLTADTIARNADNASNMLGANLYNLMLHWDNRDDEQAIHSTLHELSNQCEAKSCRLGISGIKHLSHYQNVLHELQVKHLDIEVKSNFLINGEHYYSELYTKDTRVWAYGISGSGLKLDPNEYRKDSYVTLTREANYHDSMLPVRKLEQLQTLLKKYDHIANLYQLSMLISELNSDLSGYIISPTRISQLEDAYKFIQIMQNTALITNIKEEVAAVVY
jgi:aryl-alcohol dehydrogenase-like predicted oxidoreductase